MDTKKEAVKEAVSEKKPEVAVTAVKAESPKEEIKAGARMELAPPAIDPPAGFSFEQQREAWVKEAHTHLDAANVVVKRLAGQHGERYHRVLNKLHETLGALAQ